MFLSSDIHFERDILYISVKSRLIIIHVTDKIVLKNLEYQSAF